LQATVLLLCDTRQFIYALNANCKRKLVRKMRSLYLSLLMILCPIATVAAAADSMHEVRIEFGQRVKMRDGVELSADLYRPAEEGKYPVILVRTPYNKGSEFKNSVYSTEGHYFGSHGYVYVAMDVRGRGDSDGIYTPQRNEGHDGYDSIEWAAQQPWSTGKVGTLGASYVGYDQWLAAVNQPPHLTTMVVLTTPPDPFIETPTGLQSPTYLSLYYFVSGHVLQNLSTVDWNKLYYHLPLNTMDEAGGRRVQYWKDIIDHPGISDWWDPLIYQTKFNKVNVPVLNVSGWYDDEQAGATMNYIGMITKGPADLQKSHKLLMGPWPHAVNSSTKLGAIDFGPTGVIDLSGYELRWFDHWLKGAETGIMQEPPVRMFLMGANKWLDEPSWPLSGTKQTKFYLSSNGRANSLFGNGKLALSPATQSQPDVFSYDPKDPVPYIMDETFAQLGGPDDYRPVERRDDILVFTADPFTEDTTICGPVTMQLSASSSAKDTDFTGKLLDVWPDGFAQRLSDGLVRARFRTGGDKQELLNPGQIYTYQVDLWNTCQLFKKGHSVRVEVSSSAFPKYDRNQNTGEPLGKTSNTAVAKQTIYHDQAHPSFITLPIIAGDISSQK
jgi:putative CocE/NonD family hydrolase